MKKQIALSFFLGCTLTVVCMCVILFPFKHWFLPPQMNAQCLPLEYVEDPAEMKPPDRYHVQPGVSMFTREEVPVEAVKTFYDQNLVIDSDPDNWEEGHWQREEVRPGEFLYHCEGTLNWEDGERGCIYLRERDGKTIIERIWIYSATHSPLCEWHLSELPE